MDLSLQMYFTQISHPPTIHSHKTIAYAIYKKPLSLDKYEWKKKKENSLKKSQLHLCFVLLFFFTYRITLLKKQNPKINNQYEKYNIFLWKMIFNIKPANHVYSFINPQKKFCYVLSIKFKLKIKNKTMG